MPNKVLTRSEILSIVKDRGGAAKAVHTPKWPSIEDKKRILEAAKQKDDAVELSSGRFTVQYDEGIPYTHISGIHSTIYVMHEKKGVPCGWFDEVTLERELSEKE